MESKIKNENYVVIQGWMITELGLKGSELFVYAIIYGFSQAEDNIFKGSLQYLADWTNSDKRSVQRNLLSLCEKGLITKTEKVLNNVKFCEYTANSIEYIHCEMRGYGQNVHSIDKMSIVGTKCLGGIDKMSTNNIDIIDRKIDSINKSRAHVREDLEKNIRYLETLEYIKTSTLQNKEAYAQVYRCVTDILFNACTSNRLHKLNGNMYTSKQLYEIFREFTDEEVFNVVNNLLSIDKTVKNIPNYILTALVNEPNAKNIKNSLAAAQAKRDIESQGGNEE